MDLVNAQVAEGRYASPDAYVQALLERDERRRKGERNLAAKIQEALDSGPATPMTRADWESIEREALARWERERAKK
jgi:putative addiction module CopG family antidote